MVIKSIDYIIDLRRGKGKAASLSRTGPQRPGFHGRRKRAHRSGLLRARISRRASVWKRPDVNQDKINELRNNHTLHSDKFYVASGGEHVLETDSYYGILRNPHLSRNEQCALQPYKDSLYNRYFDQLKGVVMISNRSAVAAALSGADFDGDIVKIVIDRTINQAILDAVYEKEVPQEGGTSRRNKFRRKLPIVSISSPKGSDRKVGRWISCNDARAVFSSRVGLISNLAIKIGKEEYNNHALPEESAALCTIATGLEIDSVKNGISPSLGYLEKLCQETDDGFLSAYKSFKSHMSDEKEKADV